MSFMVDLQSYKTLGGPGCCASASLKLKNTSHFPWYLVARLLGCDSPNDDRGAPVAEATLLMPSSGASERKGICASFDPFSPHCGQIPTLLNGRGSAW